MAKKILIISVVALALGSGLVPGGILIEDYINKIVVNSVDEGLLGIEEAAIPLIEPIIKEKGIPKALRGIRDLGIPILEDMVEATFVAVLINTFVNNGGEVFSTYYPPIGRERFFNNDTTGVWVIFSGVSQYHTESLNFTDDAQNRILYGNSTTVSGYVAGIQGFLNDTSTGSGVANYLDQFHLANSSQSDDLKITMRENYNCTWYQLTKLYEYINDYLIDLIIPIIIANNLHVAYMPALAGLLSVNAIAKALFMEQWANGTVLNETIYEGGIDFSEMLEEVNDTLIGFEVGRQNPSNITRKSAYALFDEVKYANALTNDTGIEQWINAVTNNTIKDSLMNEFNVTQIQIEMILFWLFKESFQEDVVPELMKLPRPDGVGMNITEYAKVLFLEQWANGTADGEILYPFGFPLTLKAGIIYGFEVGYQGTNMPVLKTNMSLNSAQSLWDITNEYSLVNKEGLMKWYSAIENPTSPVIDNLKIINLLEDNEINMILSWLPKFRDNVMPYLAQEKMNLPMDSNSFSNSIELGMVVSGGIIMGLGLLGLAINILKKRKLSKRTFN
ncbi:MAG: hypothetical protein ACFFDF_13270 [Candidatus Odinarchaeota archaeon]